MPCEDMLRSKTETERKRIIAAALGSLEKGLATGRIAVVVGAQGAVAFRGWSTGDRQGLADVCAFRGLTARNSPALAAALRSAQVKAGRTYSPQMVAAGQHSHDGGGTWHRGH